jgi:hypothetical protein
MDEQISGGPPIIEAPVPPLHKDRSAGLMVFGIFTILLGGLCGLFVPMMLLGQLAAAKTTQTSISALLPAVMMYGGLAVALVWLGIGSIKARRWARVLLLIFSWSWLGMGLVVLALMAFVMPKIMANVPAGGTANQPAMTPEMMAAAMTVMLVVFGVIFVILPAAWVFFYKSQHVKATCEIRDPVPRWTDACPLPVLGFCLWLLLGVPMMLVMPLSGHCVMPFFGMFLTGLPGALFCLAVAVIWGYSGWSLYKLEPRGWWLILIALVASMVSGLLTFARHEVVEMYELMNYSPAQIEQMQKTGFLQGNTMEWLMVYSVLPFLIYLLFIKKFLRRTS